MARLYTNENFPQSPSLWHFIRLSYLQARQSLKDLRDCKDTKDKVP